jgi:hypothetical protein
LLREGTGYLFGWLADWPSDEFAKIAVVKVSNGERAINGECRKNAQPAE